MAGKFQNTTEESVLSWVDSVLGAAENSRLPDMFVARLVDSIEPCWTEGWPIDECAKLFRGAQAHIGSRWLGRYSVCLSLESTTSMRLEFPSVEEIRSLLFDPVIYFFDVDYLMSAFDPRARFTAASDAPIPMRRGEYYEFVSAAEGDGEFSNQIWFHAFTESLSTAL
jgi:hypothetical protein